MGWAQVGIRPRKWDGISWRNQFIGNLWGVRSGRLIPGNQALSVLPALDRSDSTVSTYHDDGAPADRRLLTRHGPRDKYRTPIKLPSLFSRHVGQRRARKLASGATRRSPAAARPPPI